MREVCVWACTDVRICRRMFCVQIHVGDDLVSDVSGARAMGMRTVWYNGKKKPLPDEYAGMVDAVITDIRQLDALVQLWS